MSSGMDGVSAVGGETGGIESAAMGGMAGTVLIRESPFSLPDNSRASGYLLYHERSLCREEPTSTPVQSSNRHGPAPTSSESGTRGNGRPTSPWLLPLEDKMMVGCSRFGRPLAEPFSGGDPPWSI